MRSRILLVAVGLAALCAGCSWFRSPPEAGITTGATVIYNGGPGGELFSLCDKGNLVYLTKSQPAVAIVKDGCNPAVHDTALAQLAALQRIADRPVERPIKIPTPLPVLLMPGSELRSDRAEPRDPVVVNVPACPVCPAFPEIAPPVATPLPAPLPPAQAKQMPAPKAGPKVVVQADPNTASETDLERLPGVTVKMAQAIAKGRPYRTLQDLVAKKALTDAELAALAPYLVIR